MIWSWHSPIHEQERLDILLIYDISSSWHIYFGAHPHRRSTWADVSSFDVASDIELSRKTGFIHSVTGVPVIAKGKNSARSQISPRQWRMCYFARSAGAPDRFVRSD